MSIKIIDSDFDKEIFNAAAVNPLQSWQWGEARKKMGIEVLRLGEFDYEELKNVFTVTFHKLPKTPFTVGYLPRSVVPSEDVIRALSEEGKKRKAIFIKVEPYEIQNENGEMRNERELFQISNFKSQINKSPHPLFPSWTQIVDLTKSEEELLSSMKPKTRYNIKLAQKHGVEIREMISEEGFEIFSKLYFETTKRQDYRGHNKQYHRIVFESLKKEITRIFIAFYSADGRTTPLSAFELFIFNDVAYYPYGGSSLEHRNVMAPNLLMWECLRFAKASGCKKFDMWGSLPPDYDQGGDWAGFTRFKQGFGGEFVEFVGSYDLVLNTTLYTIYNMADKLRKKLL